MDQQESKSKEQIKLFLTALLQVSLVSMNVVFISKHMVVPMLISSFGLSYCWTLNTKKIALGGFIDRIIYASGACTGTGIGYFIAKQFI
jgi:hypothetical protein